MDHSFSIQTSYAFMHGIRCLDPLSCAGCFRRVSCRQRYVFTAIDTCEPPSKAARLLSVLEIAFGAGSKVDARDVQQSRIYARTNTSLVIDVRVLWTLTIVHRSVVHAYAHCSTSRKANVDDWEKKYYKGIYVIHEAKKNLRHGTRKTSSIL